MKKRKKRSTLTNKLDKKEADHRYYLSHKDHHKITGRKWYIKNKEKVRQLSKEYYSNNKDKCLSYAKVWTEKNRSKVRYYSRVRQKRERWAVIDAMGGKCVVCGFSDKRALQVDHVHGGGLKELRAVKSFNKHYKNVLNSFNSSEGKYQILCANCNWIKRDEMKECKPDETYKK